MFKKQNFWKSVVGMGAAAAMIFPVTGCRELPGTPGQQGAVIGGAGGAAAGAAIAKDNRVLGALIGGALGAGGGYLIGANKDKITGNDSKSAEEAVRRAQSNPATPQQAVNAATADLNNDGFVTMDEVVAMKKAGFSDQQMLDKLRATGQVFELTNEQQQYLMNNGVSQNVISHMPELNREIRNQILGQTSNTGQQVPSVVGRPQ